MRAPIRVAGTDLQVTANEGKLQITATGALPLLDFAKGALVAVVPMSRDAFFVDGGDHTRLAFQRDGATAPLRLVLNPGPWQVVGRRVD